MTDFYTSLYNYVKDKTKINNPIHNLYMREQIGSKYNKELDSCRAEEERIRVAARIRSEVHLDPLSDIFLMAGYPGHFI